MLIPPIYDSRKMADARADNVLEEFATDRHLRDGTIVLLKIL